LPPESRELPLRVYAALCGPIVGVIAAVALLGWQFDDPRLRSLLPDQVAMNPATAFCFLLSGLALWCVRSSDAGRRTRLLATGCAGIVALLAVVKLWGIATGHEVGFDQVPFSDRLAGTATTPPNRMAPNTALSFVFIGGSLVMLARPGDAFRRASHLLAIPALLLAVFALLGYAYGVQAFYGVTTYIPMALNTVLAFFFLSSAILVSRPGAGIASLLVADDGGGHLLRRLLPATFAILAISGWLELQGVSSRLFDPRFGVTFVVALNLLVLTTLGLASARWISRSDSALREARLLFDSNPQPMWVYDMESLAFLAVNQAAVRQYGYTAEEFLGMTLRDIRPPEDVPALLEEVRQPSTSKKGRQHDRRPDFG
jgi:PAS domain-containing protein